MTAGPVVFAWITGEVTNVGDSLLRRPYVAAIHEIGPLRVWINRGTREFLGNLGLPADARLYKKFGGWYVRLLSSSFRRRTVLVLNAGEFRVRPSGAVLLLLLLLAAQVVRIRGGATLWVGVSIPRSDRILLTMPYRWIGRDLDYVQWRESGSVGTIAHRTVGPDWGFLAGTPTEEWNRSPRTLCAFVLRGDRPLPSDGWFKWARDLCSDHGLQPVVVVQVRQDTSRAWEVAVALDAQVVEWTEKSSHADQEARIRGVYRESLLVIGDRLHGLIIGATEGAVPLGWVESSRGKIATHFAAVGLTYPGVGEGCAPDKLERVSPSDTSKWRAELADLITGARDELRNTQKILSTLRTTRSPTELTVLGRSSGRLRYRPADHPHRESHHRTHR